MLFDMPLEQLRTYRPPREEPPDFDAFWQQTLAEARDCPLNAVFEPVDYGLRTVDTVFKTLSYFDGVNFAARSKAQALFSMALMDLICPPSTVFAAYNHFAGPKDIRIYRYNDHEGGGNYQTVEKVKFLTEIWPER